MNFLLPTFKIVSITSAGSAIVTGLQALLYPVSFSHSFGVPNTIAKDENLVANHGYVAPPQARQQRDRVVRLAHGSFDSLRQVSPS